jgi:hypothetical protein
MCSTHSARMCVFLCLSLALLLASSAYGRESSAKPRRAWSPTSFPRSGIGDLAKHPSTSSDHLLSGVAISFGMPSQERC